MAHYFQQPNRNQVHLLPTDIIDTNLAHSKFWVVPFKLSCLISSELFLFVICSL